MGRHRLGVKTLKTWIFYFSGALVLAGLMSQPTNAQTCGGHYVVRALDSLSGISKKAYGTSRKWRTIYNANFKTVGKNPGVIYPGQSLRIPCDRLKAPVKPIAAKPSPVKQVSTTQSEPEIAALPKISLLTAGGYQPFTDQALPQGGMLTAVIERALQEQHKKVAGPSSKVVWINDWAAHLNPLLANKVFDLGFPWFRPDCKNYDKLDDPAKYRCDAFYFSKPVFEILVVFFKMKNSSFTFPSDNDVIGKKLCRPAGYFTFDLDKGGRNWIKDKKIILLQPQSVDECFKMLEKGEVDAVALNEFTGRAAVKKGKMQSVVDVLDRPVSILTLHVIVAKSHKRAKALLKYVNEGLAAIRADGIYGEIVDKHLTRFWKEQGES